MIESDCIYDKANLGNPISDKATMEKFLSIELITKHHQSPAQAAKEAPAKVAYLLQKYGQNGVLDRKSFFKVYLAVKGSEQKPK